MVIRGTFAKVVVCIGALALAGSCAKAEQPEGQQPAPSDTSTSQTSGAGGDGAGAGEALAAAAETTASANTGRVEGEMEVVMGGAMLSDDLFEADPAELPTEDVSLKMSVEGAYDVEAEQSDMTMRIDEVAGPIDELDNDSGVQGVGDAQQVITDGNITYTRQTVGGEVELVDGKEWVRDELTVSADEPAIPGLSDSGIVDPTQLLEQLHAASDEVTDEGTVEINGVETTHYHAELSLERLAEQTSEEAASDSPFGDLDPAELYGDLTLPVDIYVDGDGMVRRYEIDADLGELFERMFTMMFAIFGGMGEEMAGETGGSMPEMPEMDMTYRMKVSIDFLDLGEPVDITIPDESEVTDQTGASDEDEMLDEMLEEDFSTGTTEQ